MYCCNGQVIACTQFSTQSLSPPNFQRQQSVVVNGASSEPMNVVSGVPQGFILGPLLFLIYIDNIADVNLSDGSKIVLYADDILLYHPISLPMDLEYLQKDVDTLQIFATANYLTFNVSKCKFMLVSRKKQHTVLAPSISVYGSPLESTTTFKYLGLIKASDLSWTTHIDNICSKAKRILGLCVNCMYLWYGRIWNTGMQLQCDLHICIATLKYFAARICTKNWNAGYYDLLDILELPQLAQCRLHTRLYV